MPIVSLRNLDVKFPYQPYDLQKNMMTAMIDSAQQHQNALIDSPTGTGKTLCLLTSLLAWREAYCDWKRALKNPESVLNVELLKRLHSKAFGPCVPFKSDRDCNEPLPKIFYASRTHSQLSQVAEALKKTAYNPQTVLLASREQLCSNDNVKQLHAGDISSKCRSLVKAKQCQYHLGSQNISNVYDFKQTIMDIEEIGEYAKKRVACAFYMNSEVITDAHIVLLPYQYLIDERTRESQKIDLSNAIVIFDEGHNVESVCTESTSKEISVPNLMRCISELNAVLLEFREGDIQSRLETGERLEERNVELFKKSIEKLISIVNNVPLSTGEMKNSVQPGQKIFDYLKDAGFDDIFESPLELLELMQRCEKILNLIEPNKKKSGKFGLSHLQPFYRLIKMSVVSAKPDLLRYYRLNIQQKNTSAPIYQAQMFSNDSFERVVNMWCLSAEVAMTALSQAGARSIVFASGTLSPLESFAAEFGLIFSNRVENPHVIQKDQIYVSSVPRGPSNYTLNSSFQNRDSQKYILELGSSIYNICVNVPEGVLVFFSGYLTLEQSINTWKTHDNIWSRISKVKVPFCESKNKEEFKSSILQYEKTVLAKKGAVLFAVCRGKASEGIDFSDGKARAVVLCGIPFPNFKDPFVVEKKKVLDSGKTLSKRGDAWYNQQGFRALNQAIGRVIRHRNDYGAVIFLDDRFAASKNVQNLPLWIRSDVIQYDKYGKMLADCRDFFKYHAGGKKDVSLLPKQTENSLTIEYKSNNGVLNLNRNTPFNFHDPLQLAIAAPPVNKTIIDPLQIEKSWKRGRAGISSGGGNGAKENPLKWNMSVKEDHHAPKELIKRRPQDERVAEKAEFKKHTENFATHIVSNRDTQAPEPKRQCLDVQMSSTSTSTSNYPHSLPLRASEADAKKGRNETASRFIFRFKRELPGKYEDFKILIAKYSKRRITQDQIIQKTADFLFTQVTPADYEDRYSLFKMLSAFISAKHNACYEELLQQYKPR